MSNACVQVAAEGLPVTPHKAALISPAITAAIDAHRATIAHDETLYGEDCTPLVGPDVFVASDAEIAKAFAALVAVPCLNMPDAAAKAEYILAGSGGLRDHGWSDEFLNLLIPDNQPMFDPAGPLVVFLRSLCPTL